MNFRNLVKSDYEFIELQMVQEKMRFQKAPLNYALEKGNLIKLKVSFFLNFLSSFSIKI